MRNLTRSALAGALLLSFAATALAAGTPEQKCAAGKMKAAGKAASAKAACYAKALGATVAVDSECLAKAQAKLDAAYAKLELAGGCITTGDAAAISSKVDSTVEDVAGDLACSDGIVVGDEQCDDGNEIPGDGCSATCEVECGNGSADVGEECDDGNATNGDGCDNNCTTSACGNGITAGAEVCDDGNAVNGDGCDNNCTVSACGNGEFAPSNEECDDGNSDPFDGCHTCLLLSTCPCWTVATLDALFPAGFFDANGRGGATCGNGNLFYGFPNYGIYSADICTTTTPVPTYPRSDIYLGVGCAYTLDRDPTESGICPGGAVLPSDVAVGSLSTGEATACLWTLRASQIAQSEGCY